MIDWLTIVIALVIIVTLVGFFGFLAWKINMPDPLTGDDNNQLSDSINDKRKKERNTNEHTKKKRKDQKRSKRENKDEEQQQRNKPLPTTEETDDEQDENELELITSSTQNVETSSKARKRNKNKTRTATPPSSTTTRIEGTTKNPVTTRAPPATHPKSIPKDELELTKQQTKGQNSSLQTSNKQTASTNLSTTTTTNKKTTQPVQKQQQRQQNEQTFTVVGGNRHKTATPPLQQQQQQNKPQVNTTTSVAPVQQPTTSTQLQHEQLAQRQQLPQQEKPAPLNNLPVKQQQQQQALPKIADLLKILPSTQVVVTELMSALDAVPLSADELDIIMHKIANKQSVIKQDWNKLQHGQKVDPQAHIGQILDESAKAYEDDMKNNSIKRIKELTDELNAEKRRSYDLLKEKNDKQREIQILHAQLDSIQHKHESTTSGNSQQKFQTLELQLQRITEENIHLNHQLTQQQTVVTSNLTNNTDLSNIQIQVLSEQMKKLSVDNIHWEKKAHSNELLAKEAQKEKEDLIRYNEQLTQSLQNAEKDLKHIEEKHHKQLNDYQTLHLNEINELKRHIQQLEKDNEQLKREEIVHIEPPPTTTNIQTLTVNNEEREQLENEIQQLKQIINLNQQKQQEYQDLKQKLTNQIENLQINLIEQQTHENELKQEIQRFKQEQQQFDESRNNELNKLRNELNEVKSIISQSEDHLHQEREKQRRILVDLLSQDLRNQLPNDNQDFNQWLSSYRQLSESDKRTLQEEITKLKYENEQLHKNMIDIENQLKYIEKTVQTKEETLFTELKSKDVIVENLRYENEQLTGELQRLRNEIQQLQTVHDSSVSEARVLKLQLGERFLVAANSPSIVTADESFELVKQTSPSLSPIVIDIRGEQLNELIRSSKEELEDQHVNDIHHTGTGETSAGTVDESTVSSTSSDQQS